MASAAIVQPNYIPWRGYFDLINDVETFVFLDTVQYTRRDWRNRNLIKTPAGELEWLTIPIRAKGNYHSPILEIEIDDFSWTDRHLEKIARGYKNSTNFDATFPAIQNLLKSHQFCGNLSQVTSATTREISRLLGIQTSFYLASELAVDSDEPSMRLIEICKKVGADYYVSGPAAKSYLDVELFERHGIEVAWKEYGPYLPYSQPAGEYTERLSIVDFLLNQGPISPGKWT